MRGRGLLGPDGPAGSRRRGLPPAPPIPRDAPAGWRRLAPFYVSWSSPAVAPLPVGQTTNQIKKGLLPVGMGLLPVIEVYYLFG